MEKKVGELFWAIYTHDLKSARTLINQGVAIDAMIDGQSALMRAWEYVEEDHREDTDMLELLYENGARNDGFGGNKHVKLIHMENGYVNWRAL